MIQTIILQSERHVSSSKGSYRRDLETVGKNIFIDCKICDIGMLCVLFVMTSFVKLNLQFEHVSLVPTELSGIYLNDTTNIHPGQGHISCIGPRG
jgi:hypothetical protein